MARLLLLINTPRARLFLVQIRLASFKELRIRLSFVMQIYTCTCLLFVFQYATVKRLPLLIDIQLLESICLHTPSAFLFEIQIIVAFEEYVPF